MTDMLDAHSCLPQQTPTGIRFRFESTTSTVSVAVAGTFNSWVGDAAPLTCIGPTSWATTLRIDPGRHHYKYVVDGRDWIRDPANDWISEDAQDNSCFTVTDERALFIRRGQVSATHPAGLYQRRSAVASAPWLRDAVFYQLSVRAFGGTLDGARARLDDLRELGVNVVWLMPIHPIGVARREGRHGDPYAVRDFLAIDPALGDEAALRAFVAHAHRLGMRVMYDWTLNRAACDNPLTLSHPDWFTRAADGTVMYAVPGRAQFAGFDFASADLRAYLIGAMLHWITVADFDGLRFDDADITPCDFLDDIRAALHARRPGLVLLAQSCDELHHLAACDLTHDGGARAMLRAIADGQADAADFRRDWEASTYSFPRGAVRLRWLEEKEQGRAHRYFGAALHRAAATVHLTLNGVPHIMMGQEFDEPAWNNWSSLFDGFTLPRPAPDDPTLVHYRRLLGLRANHAALRHGSVEFVALPGPHQLGFWRVTERERIFVMVNLAGTPCALPCELDAMDMLYAHGAHGTVLLDGFGSIVARQRLPR